MERETEPESQGIQTDIVEWCNRYKPANIPRQTRAYEWEGKADV